MYLYWLSNFQIYLRAPKPTFKIEDGMIFTTSVKVLEHIIVLDLQLLLMMCAMGLI